ncbi:MAG TPA: hypothetical protein VGG92_04060 [Caulobacteraceae bacterium]|jgi:hypothetical protein
MQRVTLFYSWQSDRDSELCRNFIGKALERAAELLKADGVDLVVDRDTLNEPGLPPVTETILRKIEACDIFLGDLTYVARTDDGKLIPNPNVAIEFGYALKVKGTPHVLLVMNDHWGLDILPFNLGYLRRPATYTAMPGIADAERRKRREELANALAEYIGLVAQRLRAEATANQRDTRVALEEFWWRVGVSNPATQDNFPPVSPPFVMLHLTPEEAMTPPRLDLRLVDGARVHLELADAQRDQDMHAWWAHGDLRSVTAGPNDEAQWTSRFSEDCIVKWRFTFGHRGRDDPTILVQGDDLERQIVNKVDRALAFLRAVGFTGRVLVGVALYGIEDVEIPTPSGRTRPLRVQSVPLPTALIPAGLQHGGDCLKDLFDGFWRQAGAPLGSPSFNEGRWAGYSKEPQ